MNFPKKPRIELKNKKDDSPVSNIALYMKLFAERKNDYHILLPNSDTYGITEIDKEIIDKEIYFMASNAIMDFACNLEHCKPKIELSVLTDEEVFRAYNAGMCYQQRKILPMKYKMLGLAENFKLKPKTIETGITENIAVQNILMYVDVQDKAVWEEKMNRLKDDYIFTIAAYGGLQKLKDMLKEQDINRKSRFGTGLLHEAIAGNCWDNALYILDSGIDVNMQDDEGETALHYIAQFENMEVAKKIFEKGGDINIKKNNGGNAFLTAALFQRHNHPFLELMMAHNPTVGKALEVAETERNEFLINLIKQKIS